MASSSLLHGYYLCSSHHGNRKASGRAHKEQSIKPGGRPITCPQQSGSARSTPPAYVYLRIATNSLCNQEANAALTKLHLNPPPFHFPPNNPSISSPPTHFVLLLQFLRDPHLAWQYPPLRSSPLCIRQWGCLVEARGGQELQEPLSSLSCFHAEQWARERVSFQKIYWASQASCSHSLFKVVYCQLIPLQLFQRDLAHQDTADLMPGGLGRMIAEHHVTTPCFPFPGHEMDKAQRKK